MGRSLLAGLLLCSTAALAEADNGDRVKSVQRRPLTQTGRVSVAPAFAFSVGDPFWQSVGGGLAASWHLAEAFALEGNGLGFSALPTDQLRVAKRELRARISAPHVSGIGDLSLVWAPVYGKFAFGANIAHFEIGVLVGGGTALLNKESGGGFVPQTCWGVRERIFFSEWIAFDAGVTTHLFLGHADVGGASLGRFGTLVSGSLGLALYFPDSQTDPAP